MCTDGASSILKIHSWFKAHIKQVPSHATFIHRVLHRYALAVKTLPPNLGEVFCAFVKIVHHISDNGTNFRMFEDLYEEVGTELTPVS
jgi:hypothetical protein